MSEKHTFDNGVTIDASEPLKTNWGGPAFPCEIGGTDEHGEYRVPYQGMTLRDYFAAKAMQALLTSRHTDYENGWYDEQRVAYSSYSMSDAMLKAREQ